MGMAASQARFLQLTARRTNIEYMGQQINQQRLALANASAGLFEKMLSMVPPTPPSSQDDKYYTQGYKITDPVDGLQKSISWGSAVTFIAGDFQDNTGAAIANFDIVGTSGAAASTFTVSAAQMVALANDETGTTTVPSANDIAIAMGVGATDEQLALGYKQMVRMVTMVHDVYNPDGKLSQVTVTGPALLTFDNLNRLVGFVSLDQGTLDATAAAEGTANSAGVIGPQGLTYGGTFDSSTYNDDMNKYEFNKATYDYQVEKINQETRQIQAQDKSLELKMKQLDTEHTAVETEMEAVQKVLQKNIEGSFKTFA